jgi:hypothetical protein
VQEKENVKRGKQRNEQARRDPDNFYTIESAALVRY